MLVHVPPNLREEAILTKVAWRLLPIMMLLYVIAYLDRINISFAGLEMNADLRFDDRTFGTGSGVFFFGYCLFGAPSNMLLEHYGARRLLAAMMIVWGCITVGMIAIQTPYEFYALRFFLGVAEAGFFPGMILYLTYWFPKQRQGLVVGKFMSAIPLAGVLGGLVASSVLGIQEVNGIPGLNGLRGWQLLFVATGIPAVLSGIVVLFCLPDRPDHAKWLNHEEAKFLVKLVDREAAPDNSSEHSSDPSPDHSQQPSPDHSSGSPGSGLLDALALAKLSLANPLVWYLSLLYFSMALGMYGFQLWLPQIIKDIGNLDAAHTALISAIPAIFQGAGMILIARHSDKTQERRLHLALSAIIAFVGLVSAALIHNPWIALVALSVSAFGIWGTVGPFWALPSSFIKPSVRASAIGLINSLGNLGGFVGPYTIGLVRSLGGGFTLGLITLACSLLCAALLVMRLDSKPIKHNIES
jgi:ACS family tartrate transporter-like MFS transporter